MGLRKKFTLFLFVQTGVFNGTVAVDHDYIRVDVVTSSGKTKGDVHMHVFPKKEVLERPQKAGGIPLNVALVMFDSTSAANFKRKLPNSLEYLTKNLNSVFMQGELIKCFILVTCLIIFISNGLRLHITNLRLKAQQEMYHRCQS